MNVVTFCGFPGNFGNKPSLTKRSIVMNFNENEKLIIEKYQQEEKMMILLFAQWCINHDLNPLEIYTKAYPDQVENPLLKEAIETTVAKEESDNIPFSSLLTVLEMYGNEELCFILTELKEK
jgi:hypothetical protein